MLRQDQSQPRSGGQDIDEAAARRQRRILIGLIVGLMVMGAGVGVLLAALSRHNGHRTSHHGSAAVLAVAIGVAVVGVAVLVAWASWLYRRPSYRPVMQYGWRRRARVGKALRRGQPVAPGDQPIAAAIVAVQRRQRWLPWLYPLLGAVWLINALTHHGAVRWFWLILGIVYLIMLPIAIRQRRRMLSSYDRDLLRNQVRP